LLDRHDLGGDHLTIHAGVNSSQGSLIDLHA
jgi:hypothetical protein